MRVAIKTQWKFNFIQVMLNYLTRFYWEMIRSLNKIFASFIKRKKFNKIYELKMIKMNIINMSTHKLHSFKAKLAISSNVLTPLGRSTRKILKKARVTLSTYVSTLAILPIPYPKIPHSKILTLEDTSN